MRQLTREDAAHAAPLPQADGWCCPVCAAPLEARPHGLWCAPEHRFFATIDGVHRLLPEERRREVLPSVERERRLRREEPCPAPPEADLAAGLDAAASRMGRGALRVLVAGPGHRWAAATARARGHAVALVDLDAAALVESAADGGPSPRAEADFEALPLEAGLFDVVVAAGALHHAGRLTRALVELRRVTRRRGALVVVGSPAYGLRSSGERAVERRMAEEERRYGYALPREQQPGFLVLGELRDGFRAAGWSLEVRGGPGGAWRRARDLARRLRGGTELASWPLVVGAREG